MSGRNVSGVSCDRFSWERTLRAAGDIVSTRLFVALTLGTYIHGATCSPGVRRLAADTGLCERTVRLHLRKLVDAGWLVILAASRRGRSTVYGVSLPGLFAADDRQPGAAQGFDGRNPGAAQTADDRQPGAAQGFDGRNPGAAQTANDRQPGAAPLQVGRSVPTTVGASTGPPMLAALAGGPVGEVLEQLPAEVRPRNPAQVHAMSAAIAERLRNGWSIDAIVRRSEPDPPGFRVKFPDRFFETVVPLWPPASERAGPSRPAWCGQCDELTRMLELDDGSPYRCPSCHPLAVAR